jgi:SAM-dependent methyltransferase
MVLDLACGTGLSTFKLAETIGEGVFHGVDLSPEMIKKAKENGEKLGYSIDFRFGDVENLPYTDASFDAVVSNMSFQMFPNKKRALDEIFRVLLPNGTVGLLYGSDNHLHELVSICKKYVDEHPELVGFRDSVYDVDWMHIDLDESQRLLWGAGFRKPLVYGYHRVMHVKPSVFWYSNPYPAMWRSHIPVEKRERVDSEIIQLMEEASDNRGFRFNWYTIQAYASKPV